MARAPCCDKNGLKKGPWTPEEDQKLMDYIQKHGHGSWRTLPKNAGLQRCGKSCRLRWANYLRPDIKRGRFSFEEEETIIQLHSVLGNKWSAIAARLPGRTDNEIKNYWNTHIRKRLLRMGIDPVTHSPRFDLLDISSLLNSSQFNVSRFLGVNQPELLNLATTLFSSQCDQNPDFIVPNLQETLLFDSNQIENQFQFKSNQVQELQACTTSTSPFSNDPTQFVNPNVDQFQSIPTNFSTICQNSQSNLWEDNVILPINLMDNFIPVQNCGSYGSDQSIMNAPLSDHSNFQPNILSQNFSGFGSTPSSSPTTLNSCSTYITSSTEDEKESYCSNGLKFEMGRRK